MDIKRSNVLDEKLSKCIANLSPEKFDVLLKEFKPELIGDSELIEHFLFRRPFLSFYSSYMDINPKSSEELVVGSQESIEIIKRPSTRGKNFY
jgi:hypothetical protein